MTVETSIVIRTLNEAKHLEKLLQGIHDQNYHNWEIILVDSGSTDGTLEIASRYGARIFHIPQAEFTFGRSLNLGCQQAEGKILLFASGHVWPVSNNWLRNMVKPFEEPAVAMVYGRQRGTDANRISESKDLEDQFGPTSHILVDEPKGNNGNAATRQELWLDQPFDESLPGLEDVDWARKAEKKGYRVYYAANAVVYHSHEETLGQVYNRYFREAVATKRMFPHNQFPWSDLVKGVPYFTLRDTLYALRKRKPRKIFQIPSSRFAHLLGIYRGFRYQKQLSQRLIGNLQIPESFQSISVGSPGEHEIIEAKIPVLQGNEVLIKVAYASVCSSNSGNHCNHTGVRSNKPSGPSSVQGQVYSGIVVRFGGSVSRFKTGQKVVGNRLTAQPAGKENTNVDVAFAEYVVAIEPELRKLPMDVSLKQATLLDGLASCIANVRHLRSVHGDSICVLGAGSIGNLYAQVLAAWGLQVTVVDPEPRWLALLHKYDIDTLVELENLERFNHLIDAATSGDSISNADWHASWNEAAQLVRKGVVRLDDHTDAIEQFEDYGKAWERTQSKNNLNVLLQISKDLESL